ncbi:FKBP-type peptidyl-prolyl cis-trans isomerase [Aquiflexum gelatinilyticum]|uniref:FKBP-type peptidyl-prolyl cis-trans isomerase n=1 Tax=Aquiflexum gelatinilyticum TaxID=2961943 RepID=UPI00216A0FCB|nr:FKBP-type peptidyl-prolyl cis-trans isomerase [Aquiflexum gelatinilyticum]MCS4433688.1 FKBP-type peptidyl-prolyl cis-trans isomerase [Aquiflexum gelatinilyticum]
MKKAGALLLSLVWIFSSCVSDEENAQIIFDKDIQKIEKYITQNPIASVKEEIDGGTGIRIYWTELSGSGDKVSVGDTVFVNYTGKLLSNLVFDTSIESIAKANNVYDANRTYEPLEFIIGLGMVIPGFEYGVFNIEKGDKASVIFPSLYGYGSQANAIIPPNSPLIFEIELVDIKDNPLADD